MVGQGPFLCLEQVCALRTCLTPDHRQPGKGPRHGGQWNHRRSDKRLRNFRQKNSSRVGWASSRYESVNQPSSPLPSEPPRQQLSGVLQQLDSLVAVLADVGLFALIELPGPGAHLPVPMTSSCFCGRLCLNNLSNL